MIALEVLRLWNANELEIDNYLYFDWSKGLEGLVISLNVSDRFYWATADSEPVLYIDHFELLEETVIDCAQYTEYPEANDVTVVYAARRRNVQPMPRYCKGVIGVLTKDLPPNTDWDWGRKAKLEELSQNK